MGVAKMKYLNVYGPEKRLQSTLGAIARSACFAPESDEAMFSSLQLENNRYEPLLTKAKGLLTDLGHSSLAPEFTGDVNTYNFDEVADYLEKFALIVAERNKAKTDLETELELCLKTDGLLSRMQDLDVSLDDLFKVSYLKVRIGRLPKSSYVRLSYYADKGFNFTSYFNFTVYDFDGQYYWGLYFAPLDNASEVDDIFKSLYFERIWVPEFVHGKPGEALQAIRKREQELQQQLKDMHSPTGSLVSDPEVAAIQEMCAWLSYVNQLFEMKKYALVFNHTFYISGFVPEDEYQRFEAEINKISAVHIKEADQKQEVPAKPPVKLKNHWFSKPYQMYTEMYGLPSYNDIDPTSIVAVLYSLLYGIMFADLGQGIVLALVGYFFMYKKKNMAIGAILARAGTFSAIFGILFGSVFGYEHLMDSFWKSLGVGFLPFDVMAASSVNTILIGTIAGGIVVVCIAIIMNILTRLKRKQYGEAITGPNGIAGLVFYLSIIALLVDRLVLQIGFSSNIFYMIFLILLPVISMYLQEPLNQLIDEGKIHIESVPDLLMSGFFELFVTMLEYLANTVSFLRVGGFILAHAGMMSVVVTLAEMAGNLAPLVMIFGNIFVIALEGLIVGIQALRLNYYELFSRFYDAEGTPFEPLQLKPDTVEL